MRVSLALAVTVMSCKQPSPPPPDRAVAPTPSASSAPSIASANTPATIPSTRASTGPFEVPFLGTRTVYFVAPHKNGPARLMAMLHGVCNPPGYACGYWAETAKDLGFLVCPTGDGSCGPGMYNAPTWNEPDAKIDDDLERAIATVGAAYPGELQRDDAVLLGFSRGAYVSAKLAAAHPGRWPYLVWIEANPSVSAAQLRASGVRAVALLAGEFGSQLTGERKTAERLVKDGMPARLWVMRKAGHHYSDDIEALLREAISWVTSQSSQPVSKDGGP